MCQCASFFAASVSVSNSKIWAFIAAIGLVITMIVTIYDFCFSRFTEIFIFLFTSRQPMIDDYGLDDGMMVWWSWFKLVQWCPLLNGKQKIVVLENDDDDDDGEEE